MGVTGCIDQIVVGLTSNHRTTVTYEKPWETFNLSYLRKSSQLFFRNGCISQICSVCGDHALCSDLHLRLPLAITLAPNHDLMGVQVGLEKIGQCNTLIISLILYVV
jgi:hypothetical protein